MSFRDPLAYLTNEGYQLSQSLMAFGSGGLFGMGLGMGRQKYAFLPYPESDFIFAVVGEDLGLVGCLSVLALFAAFVFFGLRVAIRCEDRFGSLLAGGIACMIGVQCVMNVAVVIGLMPTTGLPLPFFSYRRNVHFHSDVRRRRADEYLCRARLIPRRGEAICAGFRRAQSAC